MGISRNYAFKKTKNGYIKIQLHEYVAPTDDAETYP